MCKRCVSQTGDPRDGAYQTLPVVESISTKERDKLRQGQPAYVVLTAFQNDGEAKMISLTMGQDPAVEAVKLTSQTVCLN